MEASLGYDPAVSTHKASSISSTSTASTWDYPLSNYSGNEDVLDDSIIQHSSCFEDYHFEPAIERLPIPKLEMTNDYSLAKSNKQKNTNALSISDREERFFSDFITPSSAIEENGIPDLVSPFNSSSTVHIIENTKKQSVSHEAITPEKERGYHETEKSSNIINESLYNNSNNPDVSSHVSQYLEPITLIQAEDNLFEDDMINNRKRRSTCAFSKHSNPERPIQPKKATSSSSSSFTAVEEPPVEKFQSETTSLSSTKRSKLNKDGLTEDEKRANHIASEQKRRNAIRTGFKELTEIVPTLKNINNSKSTILFKAVEYMRHLDKRNRGLREKIASLRVRMDVEDRYRSSPSRAQQLFAKRYNNSSKLGENYVSRGGNSKFNTNRHYSNENEYIMSSSNSRDLCHLPAHTVSALMAHKNQQRQLELLQEQLRVQQQLLAKHNIIPEIPGSENTHNDSSNNDDVNVRLGSHSLNSHMRPHFSYTYSHHPTQYNSISIPSTNDDVNESVQSMMKGKFIQSNTAALIVPQDEDDGPWRPSEAIEISEHSSSRNL